jgi:hypothetical protein
MTINKPMADAQKNDLPVKLPNGKLHLGWPSRMDTPQEMIKDFREGRRHPILLSPEKTRHALAARESSQTLSDFASLRSPLTARISTDNVHQLSPAGASGRLSLKRGTAKKVVDNQSFIGKQYDTFTKQGKQRI